jgi:hypothetical protein
MHTYHRRTIVSGLAATAVLSAGCVNVGAPTTRLGMVEQEGTGLMFGSTVERNLVTDPSFYQNPTMKLRVRNTSGDTAFNIGAFKDQIGRAFDQVGYAQTAAPDFGLLVDVNVMYSGQISSNLSNEFAFLGAAGGGIAGASQGGNVETAAGVVAGATLGSILGSFVTDDTYIIITDVTFGIVKDRKQREGKTVTFSRSKEPWEDEDEDLKLQRGFRDTVSTQVAVYAGGRNVRQSEIAQEVRERMVRIVSNII